MTEPRAICITIPGEPVAQGRPRAVTIKGRARVFDPQKSRDWKATAQQHARDAWGYDTDGQPNPPIAGPVRLRVFAAFTMPKSQHRKRQPRGRQWHTKRPDADNVLKAVKDAMTGVLWLDDSQVCVETVRKITEAQGVGPSVVVAVEPIEGEPD